MSILSLLLSPDKEAAAVFTFLGYYPFVKPWFEKFCFGWLWKLLMFNVSIGILYFLILQLFGLSELAGEYSELGTMGGCVMIVLGNITFFLLDKLLTLLTRKIR